jgi:hydrogenase-4 component F
MPLILILLPFAAGLVNFLVRYDGARRTLLVLTAGVHLALVSGCWVQRPAPMFTGWLAVDALGLLVLTIASALFFAASVYGVDYLAHESPGVHPDFFQRGRLFANEPEAVFVGALLFFLAAMSMAAVSHHFGLLWVAVEATTLASAPLIYFHRHQRSLEATWKYLLIGSVGIAIALLGTFFLAAAASPTPEVPVVVEALITDAQALDQTWLKAAFIAMLVGYGTKVGLAPMHSWLPDAHSEAPSLVSALLSGALLNTGFLGILRTFQVLAAAGLDDYARELLLLFGFLSMGIAAAFIVQQTDYKRMLAYSSVEHMGIIAIGLGVGGLAPFGAMLHTLNHSLAKGMLFLVAGNILGRYRTKTVHDVTGLLRLVPATGVLWLVGFLAITGTPPFGTFLSEFTILRGALDGSRWLVSAGFLTLLAVVFVGMASAFLRMAQGAPAAAHAPVRETVLAIAPPAVLGAASLLFGVYVPPGLADLAREAARSVGGG